MQPDLLLVHAGTMATMAGRGPARGRQAGELGLVADGAVCVGRGVIQAVGSTETVLREVTVGVDTRIVDLDGRALLPGLVDAHTHLLYAGAHRQEMARRLLGAGDVVPAARGIQAIMQATSAAPTEALQTRLLRRLQAMGQVGVTTVEVKSGYGLTPRDELRLLEIIARVGQRARVRVVSTFLGLQAPAPGVAADAHVRAVNDELLPQVVRSGLAVFADACVESGLFAAAQVRPYLETARSLGLGLKLHAGGMELGEAVRMGAALGAVSVDQDLAGDPGDWAVLAASDTMMVLLPGIAFFLGGPRTAVRDAVAAGVAVALGTGANPVSSPGESLLAAMALAVFEMGMTPAQTLVAATRNAAHAVGLGATTGSIEVGKSADLLAIDADDPVDLLYRYATPSAFCVVARGRLLVDPQDTGGADHGFVSG